MTLALEARDRAAETRRSDPTVMAGDAVVSIVMAAAATEAFINELESVYRTTMAYLRASEIATSRYPRPIETGVSRVWC